MSSVFKNMLAIVAGIIFGSLVNMSITSLGSSIIPSSVADSLIIARGLASSFYLFQSNYFVFPFLAHALGTLSGSYLTACLATTNKISFAFSIGSFFFASGIAGVFVFSLPLWFEIVDLSGAYLPMAYLTTQLIGKNKLY